MNICSQFSSAFEYQCFKVITSTSQLHTYIIIINYAITSPIIQDIKREKARKKKEK